MVYKIDSPRHGERSLVRKSWTAELRKVTMLQIRSIQDLCEKKDFDIQNWMSD